MTVEPTDHISLYTLLAPKIGEKEAAALVSVLPTSNWNDIVTRDYLDARVDGLSTSLRAEMDQRFAATNTDITNLRADMLIGFANLEAATLRASRAQLIWLIATIIAATTVIVTVLS